jgi:allantoin racemase
MRILIINPNSSADMTRAIQKAAERFAGDTFEVACLAAPGAPPFIETYEDQLKAAPGMIRLLRENESSHDGFVVACHCDPNLEAMKEITEKPVVGIGEASMRMAAFLGHRFSVVSTCAHSVPNKEALIRKYHLQDLGSVTAPGKDSAGLGDEDKILEAARLAVERDHAEVIVLGCAGLAGLDRRIQKVLKVPVLDGVTCALIIVTGLIRSGVSTSKAGRYNPLPE